MIRTLIFFVLVAALVAAGIWFVDNPGSVELQWRGWYISTPVHVAFLGLLVVIGALASGLRALAMVISLPSGFKRFFSRRRLVKGYKAYGKAIQHHLAADTGMTVRHVMDANKYLKDETITRPLAAHAALQDGDDAAARAQFLMMLDTDDQALVGLRGLLELAVKEGHTEEVRDLAEQALFRKAGLPWALMPLYNWLIAHKKWAKAAGLVPDLVKAGFVDAAAGAALEADLIILQAEAAAAENQVAEAVKMAKRAFETAPDHMPALIAYATWLVALDKGQKAASFVYEHWAKMAHPELLAIYRKAEPKEATGKVNWVQKLYATAPNLKESHLAMAAVLVETKQEDAALKHLQSYIQPNHTDRRAAMLMAQLHADDVAVANDWLYKALHAPAPETWACHACGRHTSQREAQCAGCDRVGSQFWTGGNTDLVVAEAAQ